MQPHKRLMLDQLETAARVSLGASLVSWLNSVTEHERETAYHRAKVLEEVTEELAKEMAQNDAEMLDYYYRASWTRCTELGLVGCLVDSLQGVKVTGGEAQA